MNELARFPEHEYPAVARFATDYNRRLREGYKRVKETRVVICGLARNLGDVVHKTMARMETMGRMFADYRIVIYENDSKDLTRDILQAWEKNNERVVLLTEELGEPINPGTRCLERAERMAKYRNRYRRYIAQNLSDWDYTIVCDMDLHVGWSYDGVANTFGHTGWDFMGSNGLLYIQRKRDRDRRAVHFDAWAFRHRDRPEPHHHMEVNKLLLSRGQPLFPVNSCFGGMGIYKTAAMNSCEYRGGDCEHVPFHRQMMEKGMTGLFLNPSQLVIYGLRDW